MVQNTSSTQQANRVERVLWIVMLLNGAVAFAKLAAGLLTGMISMVADGFHSTMDTAANVIGIVGIRLASQPPDDDHPYGHARFETLATLAIGGLMLVAAWEILQTAIDRLLNGGHPTVTGASFGIMLATMAVNIVVALLERRQAHILESEILAADAAHTATDVLVSISVICSLAATALGYPGTDVIVALLIVGVITRVGLNIVRQTSNTLADRQVLNPFDLSAAIREIPGIEEIVRVRSRGPAEAVHVDVDTRVKPAVTTEHAYAIARAIKEEIRSAYPVVEEVQVHFAPQRANGPTDYTLETRAVADAMGLNIHEVIPVPVNNGVALEMHVEVQPGLSLGEAHQQVSKLERRIKATVPRVKDVLTHIEPANAHGAPLVQTQAALQLRDEALEIANRLYPNANWHHTTIRLALGGYALTMHCHLSATVSVEEAHSIAEHVETSIRNKLPLIQRVTIHTEPPEADTNPG